MRLPLRLFSSTSSPNHLPPHKLPRALSSAKLAITDYLHSTRSLPFSLADHIASNSPISLRTFLSQIPFLSSTPPHNYLPILRSFLSYHPLNEFSFFFESIGLSPSHPSPTPLFLSDNKPLLSAVSSLLRFGFPWSSLGNLYLHSPSIFSSPGPRLLAPLRKLDALGFPRPCIIALSLTFPSLLRDEPDNNELLLHDLKMLFLDWDLAAAAAGDDVGAFFPLCRKVCFLYEFGWEKGGLGELEVCRGKIFGELDEVGLAQKLKFFVRLGMGKEEVRDFVRSNPVVLDVDLDDVEIVIPEYLIRIGLRIEEAEVLMKRHPFVKGKNKVGSLPGILKVLDLDKWFLNKIVHEKNFHLLSPSYAFVGSYDSKLETEFVQDLERIKLVKSLKFIDFKVDFFLSIGFGRNMITSKAIGLVRGSKEPLQERFDFLVGLGIEHSMLCRMIIIVPKLLNQCEEVLLEKVNYFSKDMGCPLEYLIGYPNFLCYDLENRVKSRCRILNWLRDIGLINKTLAPSTIVTPSENRFILILLNIHPAAPKQWLERFSSQKGHNVAEETI